MARTRERWLRRSSIVGVAALLPACGSTYTAEEIVHVQAPRASSAAQRPPVVDAQGHALAGSILTVLAPLGVSLRDADSVAGATSVGTLTQGTVVTVLAVSGRNGGWYRVRTDDAQTGWIIDDPQYSSPARSTLYQSDEHGFTALYPQQWTFVEHPAGVGFGPPDVAVPPLTVAVGSNAPALGPPGQPGYAVVSAQTVEVYGITTVLRLYDRTGDAAPTAGAGQPDHLAEILVPVTRSRAMRLVYTYTSPADLRIFEDFYNSMILPGAP